MDRPLCIECGKNKSKKRWQRNGDIVYAKKCETCLYTNKLSDEEKKARNKRRNAKPRKFGGYKKLDHCERCVFVAEHLCQLDVDHIDGNRKNNDPNNLMTLCANCHRLKSMLNGDFFRPHYPKKVSETP